jgi:SAM-dependent methyltransferase
VTDWWKTAFDSELYRILAPLERGKDFLDAELRLLPGWLNLTPGQTVLDMGCGDGRLAIPLAATGLKVVGVDRSTPLLNTARRRMGDAQGRLELIQGDMRNGKLPKPVDAALCVFATFGVFLDESDHRQTLETIAANLKPGGHLYLEAYNPFAYLRTNSATDRLDDAVIVYQTQLDHWTCRMTAQIHFARPNKPMQSVVLSWRAFTLFELTRLLEAAGFECVCANGGVTEPDAFVPARDQVLGIIARRRP